jgi:hypothetical protein
MTKRITKEQRNAYAIVGRMGGLATAKKVGKKGMRELGKKGAAARKANLEARGKIKK